MATLLVATGTAYAAKPETRVTQLVSQLPAEVPDTGVCGYQRQISCETEMTPDGSRFFFIMQEGPLLEWSGGTAQVVSRGPLGIGRLGVTCYPYYGRCGFDVSPDGRSVLFTTPDRLVAEDTDSSIDVYRRQGGTTTLVSTRGPLGGTGEQRATFWLSEDRSRLSYPFTSFGEEDPWQYEVGPEGAVTRFPTETAPAEHPRTLVRLSADDEHVIFSTRSALVPEDRDSCGTGGCDDIYERTADGRVVLLSTGPSDVGGSSAVEFLTRARDGSILFATTDRLVPQDVDSSRDIYRHSPDGRTTLMSPGTDSIDVFYVDSAPDLRWVLFRTGEALVPEDTNDAFDMYEQVGGETRLIASGYDGGLIPGTPLVSADGSKFFFTTMASLVPQDKDGPAQDGRFGTDVYEWAGGVFTLVSTGPTDTNEYAGADLRRISDDGRFVYFQSGARLTAEDVDNEYDDYVRDTVAGTTRLLPAPPAPQLPGDIKATSKDGTRVVLYTRDALVPGDTDLCRDEDGEVHGCPDLYLRDLRTGETTLLSTGPAIDGSCEGGPFGSVCPTFEGASPDLSRVYFATDESLTADDTDGGLTDIYVSRVLPPGCKAEKPGAQPKKCR